MKTAIEPKESSAIEELPTQTELLAKAPGELSDGRETAEPVREPEPPRFVQRASDYTHWGINE